MSLLYRIIAILCIVFSYRYGQEEIYIVAVLCIIAAEIRDISEKLKLGKSNARKR